MDRHDHNARIGSLLAAVPQFKEWIEAVRGLTADEQGRTVILGLDAAETEEMLLQRATDISGARFQALLRNTKPRGESRSGAQHPGESIHRTGPQRLTETR
jgi:hypothetical protein